MNSAYQALWELTIITAIPMVIITITDTTDMVIPIPIPIHIGETTTEGVLVSRRL